MDRATDRIEQHLHDEREALRSNLEELEDRVRSVVDWRRQFRGNTAAFLGLAFGGALLIGLLTARRSEALPGVEYSTTSSGRPATLHRDYRRRELSLAWRGIESVLIGVGAAKLKDTLANLLPGFREELASREGDSYERDRSTRYRS
jgi:hypothetical protein